MARNIKLFENHSSYEAYISGQDKLLPNVSYCLDMRDVHYNDDTEAIITTRFNVGGIKSSNMVGIYMYYADEGITGQRMFSRITVDGQDISIAEADSNSGRCDLEEGDHTIVYTVKDPTIIGGTSQDKIGACFSGCSSIREISIPDTVTTIGYGALEECRNINSLTIPSGVTQIISLQEMSTIQTLTVLAVTPPVLNVVAMFNTDPTMIMVPADSVEAYCNADVWSNYESVIRPIIAGGGGDGPIEK